MILRFIVFSCVMILVTACSLFEDETEWIKMWMPVDSVAISDSVALAQPITFEAICFTDDSRWQLSYLWMTHSDFDV